MASGLLAGGGAALAGPFTPGNLAIYRVGDGAGTLANTGAAVFIDEYTPTGTLVQSIALPSTETLAPNLIASGTATSEGLLNLSADGTKLTLTGYNRPLGGSGTVVNTSAATVNRMVGVLDGSGAVSLYGFSDVADGNNPRSTIVDGTKLYVGGGTGGIRYVDLSTLSAGSTNNVTTQVLSFANTRHLDVFAGQLYASNDSTSGGNTVILGSIGAGLPTDPGQTYDTLPGFIDHTSHPGSSAYGFFLADLDPGVPGVDTLYVADDADAALTKYSLVGGAWTSNGTIGANADDYRGLTASVSGTTVTLYATRRGGSTGTGGGEFVSLVDASGYNGAFAGTPTVLATAATNTSFRGIDFVPAGGGGPAFDADFNNDLFVNGLDLNNHWKLNYPKESGAVNADGDADFDQDVDGHDFLVWQRELSGTIVASASAVPEPASLVLVAMAGIGLVSRRRR